VKINPETLARASSRHPWRTVGIWAVILVLGFGASGVLLSSALTTDFDFSNNPEAKQAMEVLEQEGLQQDLMPETFVMTGPDGAVNDPAFTDQVNAALNDLRELGPDVVTTVPASYPLPKDQASDPQVAALGPIPSTDGTAVLFTVILAGDADQTASHVEELNQIRDRYTTGDTTMYMLGEPTSTDDFKKISEEDLQKGESIGILVAIIVLLIVFGSAIAGVTPIIMGIFAIGVAFGMVGVLGQLWHFSFFVPNLISMMGLAVGIDYSLFIVSRFREERSRGRDTLDAIGMTGATANRAVFFSGDAHHPAHDLPWARGRRDHGRARVACALDDPASGAHGIVRRPPRQARPGVRPRSEHGARTSRRLLGHGDQGRDGATLGVAHRRRDVHDPPVRSVLGAIARR
jgi:RND superfamily putative drug exporter